MNQGTTKPTIKNVRPAKDSDQPVHPFSMSRVLAYASMDITDAVKGTRDQERL